MLVVVPLFATFRMKLDVLQGPFGWEAQVHICSNTVGFNLHVCEISRVGSRNAKDWGLCPRSQLSWVESSKAGAVQSTAVWYFFSPWKKVIDPTSPVHSKHPPQKPMVGDLDIFGTVEFGWSLHQCNCLGHQFRVPIWAPIFKPNLAI